MYTNEAIRVGPPGERSPGRPAAWETTGGHGGGFQGGRPQKRPATQPRSQFPPPELRGRRGRVWVPGCAGHTWPDVCPWREQRVEAAGAACSPVWVSGSSQMCGGCGSSSLCLWPCPRHHPFCATHLRVCRSVFPGRVPAPAWSLHKHCLFLLAEWTGNKYTVFLKAFRSEWLYYFDIF